MKRCGKNKTWRKGHTIKKGKRKGTRVKGSCVKKRKKKR